MNNRPTSQGQAGYNQAFIWARTQLKAGVDAELLVDGLVQQGWEAAEARRVMAKAIAAQPPPPRRAPPLSPETFTLRQVRRPMVVKWGQLAFWGTVLLMAAGAIYIHMTSKDEHLDYLLYGGGLFILALWVLRVIRVMRFFNRFNRD